MPVLRLFAAAREAAGTATAEVPGLTVDEVLDAARLRYGPRFAAVVASSRVWCNGTPAAGDDPVAAADEVAVLPPVSGGSGPISSDGGAPEPDPIRPGPRRPAPAGGRRRPGGPAAGAEGPAPRPGRPGRPPSRSGRGAPDGRRGPRDQPAPRPTVRRDAPFWNDPVGAAPADRAPAPAEPTRGSARAEPARAEPARTGRPRARRPDPEALWERPAPRPRRPVPPAVAAADLSPPAPRGPARPDAVGSEPARPEPGQGRRARATGARAAAPRPDPARLPGTPSDGPLPVPRPVADPARPAARASRPGPAPAGGALTRTSTITGTPIAPLPAGNPTGGAGARPARRLTRMRSVDVPVTGQVTVRGKERQVSGTRPQRSAFARRYAVVYDTSGWKVSLGIIWFAAVVGALALGWAPLTLLYGVAAGWAAMEASRRWREQGTDADVWVAALGAGAVAASAAGGTAYLGGAILATVAVAVALPALGPHRSPHAVAVAGATLQCALPFGLAAAGVVLTRDLEIGAAVALVLFVSAYEAGDFLIGSGSSNSVEGPLTGMVTIGVTAMVVAVLQIPPFDGVPVFTFAAIAAVACALGQLVASALLPAADAHAPAVRRLDSLLLLGPVWALATGVFLDSLT